MVGRVLGGSSHGLLIFRDFFARDLGGLAFEAGAKQVLGGYFDLLDEVLEVLETFLVDGGSTEEARVLKFLAATVELYKVLMFSVLSSLRHLSGRGHQPQFALGGAILLGT